MCLICEADLVVDDDGNIRRYQCSRRQCITRYRGAFIDAKRCTTAEGWIVGRANEVCSFPSVRCHQHQMRRFMLEQMPQERSNDFGLARTLMYQVKWHVTHISFIIICT